MFYNFIFLFFSFACRFQFCVNKLKFSLEVKYFIKSTFLWVSSFSDFASYRKSCVLSHKNLQVSKIAFHYSAFYSILFEKFTLFELNIFFALNFHLEETKVKERTTGFRYTRSFYFIIMFFLLTIYRLLFCTGTVQLPSWLFSWIWSFLRSLR